MSEPKVSIEEKREEAVRRMKLLGIFSETINQFRDDGLVSISEPPLGAFYWAEGEDLEHIREFEKEHNALVYVVIRSYTEFGMLDNYLYVSDYPEEWYIDIDDLSRQEEDSGREVCAYAYNTDTPEFSDMGYIGIKRTPAAGLRRVW